jgi:hypothetical protein
MRTQAIHLSRASSRRPAPSVSHPSSCLPSDCERERLPSMGTGGNRFAGAIASEARRRDGAKRARSPVQRSARRAIPSVRASNRTDQSSRGRPTVCQKLASDGCLKARASTNEFAGITRHKTFRMIGPYAERASAAGQVHRSRPGRRNITCGVIERARMFLEISELGVTCGR